MVPFGIMVNAFVNIEKTSSIFFSSSVSFLIPTYS